MGLINFLIVKMLVKTKFANVINIAAKEEIIPELLQSDCNPNNIFSVVSDYLNNPKKMEEQVSKTQSILNNLKTNNSSAALAANALNKRL